MISSKIKQVHDLIKQENSLGADIRRRQNETVKATLQQLLLTEVIPDETTPPPSPKPQKPQLQDILPPLSPQCQHQDRSNHTEHKSLL